MKRRHSLADLSWELARSPERSKGPDWDDTIPARVPGSLLMDLYRAELVPDPYFGENFRACRWAGEWTFWYRTRFTAEQLLDLAVEPDRLVLHFETIDTYGEVFLNGHALGRVMNMFRRYDLDIARHARWDDINELIVRIDPPKRAAEEWLKETGLDTRGVTSLFDPDRPFIRKSQMTFGWDNCPYLVSGGIVRPVWIESRQGVCLEDVAWDVSHTDAESRTARLTVSGAVDRPVGSARVQVRGICGEHTFSASAPATDDGMWHVETQIKNAKLWWPHGVGEPNLYTVTISLWASGKVLDRESLKIGLRQFRVITEPAQKRLVGYRIGKRADPAQDVVMDGANIGPWERLPLDEPVEVRVRPFRLEVNGRRVFIKGLDWQNPDVLVGNETREQVCRLIDAAVNAHMNMFRMWGGGAIELEAFFQYCPERGIMVWQDFFFGCALYPRDPRFLDMIRVEAEDIVKRLRTHTSLAMWCGDNESDMVLYDRGQDLEAYLLNKRVLPEAVRRFDVQGRYYHTSSPSGGPYPRSDWGGDKRNWGPTFPHRNYWHIRQESARLISESGSKALPSAETIRRSMPMDKQWPVNNRTWRLHAGDLDHHIRGDYVKFAEGLRFFIEPQSLEEAVKASQFANAWGVKLLIDRCRQQKGECGGILIWKNADQWPCLDHGFFDYYGYPRMVYAWSKRAFAPVAVSMMQHYAAEWADLEVWLVNDLYESVKGQITLTAVTIDEQGNSLEQVALCRKAAGIGPDDSTCLFTYPVKGFDGEHTVFLASFESEDKTRRHQSTYTLVPRAAYWYHVLGGRKVIE